MTATAWPEGRRDLSQRDYALGLVFIVCAAALLRGLYPWTDPPWHASAGVVWHDEGAWVHNARNQALFGVWRTDAWNPMFLAPVFTFLEYLSFSVFGVGLWQARLVSSVAGLVSIPLLAAAVRSVASRWASLTAAALLSVNYLWVVWNRTAMMESTMVAFLVASAWAYGRARRRPAWGLLAGVLALLAFFTKASAAFYVAALALDSLAALVIPRHGHAASERRAAWGTVLGLVAGAGVALAVFVGPHWAEVRFYNWQMTVIRKPSYSIAALVDRLAWFPIVHDFFTRMWAVTLLAGAGLAGIGARWRHASAVERLFAWWIVLGAAELIVHDVGNERRFVLFIPPLVGLAALSLVEYRHLLARECAAFTRRQVIVVLPALAYAMYIFVGAVARLPYLYQVRPGVRVSALLACAVTAGIVAGWPRLARMAGAGPWRLAPALVVAGLVIVGDLALFGQWMANRTEYNHDAMVEVGRTLPAGTLVHGKLSNGLALESRIHPVFVGRAFGNYDDRLKRNDIRYLLTYRRPFVGYEGDVIHDVLALNEWRVVRRFRVAESPAGDDEAVLLEKVSPRQPSSPPFR